MKKFKDVKIDASQYVKDEVLWCYELIFEAALEVTIDSVTCGPSEQDLVTFLTLYFTFFFPGVGTLAHHD